MYLQQSSYRRRLSPRRRAAALALALALVALLILALLRLGATSYSPPRDRSLSTFSILPDGERTAAKPKQEARRAQAKAQPPPAAKPPPLPPAPLPNPAAPAMIVLSHDEMASADIGKMASAAKGDGEAADAGGGDSGSAGTAPGGQKLYVAEWYREPPPNALQLYLPKGAPAGAWATIACRTIERYHVDNCQQLEDSPPGLGLSRALRQAAWQFLVRPPRLGGKPLVGAWVRIRFTFEKPPES